MVVRVLESTKSVMPVLDYHFNKCMRDVATTLEVQNIPYKYPATIVSAFSRMEHNPRISTKVKKLGFHLTICPGELDKFDKKNLSALVGEIMSFLGYKDQPYVVFQHNDIDREHYHVVSVRVRPDGSWIDSEFEGYRLNKFLKTLEEKYSFKVGLEREGLIIKRYDNKIASVYDSIGVKRDLIESIFLDLTKYPVHNFSEVQNVLAAYDVEVKRNRVRDFKPEFGGTGYVLMIRGKNKDKDYRRWYCLERDFDIQGDKLLQNVYERNAERGMEHTLSLNKLMRALVVINAALEKSKGKDQNYLYSLLRPVGIEIVVSGEKDADGKLSYVIIDKAMRSYITRKEVSVVKEVLDIDDKVNSRTDWNWEHIAPKDGISFTPEDKSKINQEIRKKTREAETYLYSLEAKASQSLKLW